VLELSYYYIEKTKAVQKVIESDEIDRVIKYINENLSRELSLGELASIACLSANYFVRKFRAKIGVSPLKYVAIARMEKAKSLLKDMDTPISDIMAKIGFTDASHFSKAFKVLTGYSPRGYRKMICSLSDI
jgi:AraC-like DNA-binding protein